MVPFRIAGHIYIIIDIIDRGGRRFTSVGLAQARPNNESDRVVSSLVFERQTTEFLNMISKLCALICIAYI